MSVLSSLSARERWLIGLAVPVLVAVVVWRQVWLPMEAERAALKDEIAAWMQVREAAVHAVPLPAAAAAPDAPAATRVTAGAEAAGLIVSRLEPDGTGDGAGLRVSIEDADFVPLIDWIAAMEAQAALRLTAIEIDRRTAPGTVSARLTLEPLQ